MYLLLLLLVPALTNCEPDSNPSVGINLPHGSITFYGSNFGDNQGLSLPNIQTSTPSTPSYVTSYTPNFAPYTPIQSNPVTFFKNQPPTPPFGPQSDKNNPSFFSLSYSTDPKQSNPNIEVRNPSFSPFTQGPINSAVPFSLFYPDFPTTKQTTTHAIPTSSLATQYYFEPEVSNQKQSFSFSSIGQALEEKKKSSDQTQSGFLQQVKEVTLQTPTRLEDIEAQQNPQIISSSGSQKKNLQQFWHAYNGKSETDQSSDKTSLETIHTDSFSKKAPSLNDIPIPSDNRKTRKIDFSSPSAKNITGLIKKALSLVKKVEEIDDRKRTLKSSLGSSKSSTRSKKKETVRSRVDDDDKETIRELKEDKRFDDLKAFIQDQSSISNLIKSETSGLRDLVEARTSSRETSSNSKPTRDMIKALARLNSISSLLLKDNDKTKTTVRQLPDEIRNIVQSEIVELKDLLEDQNIAVASALKSAIRAENRQERNSGTSETEVIILKALAKLNKISGVLLKEQEKTEKQTSSALKALPALAKFIQAETSDIKDLIDEQSDRTKDGDLDELKDAIGQSLANDKLITRAIIKLNDITQLLLKDVNFTTTAITNKLPEALTALITSETGKIRKMIDLQNDAIVDILKESDNLARAERVIQEAQQIKQTLAGGDPNTSEERRFISESDRILEVLSPLISKSGRASLTGDGSRADKLIEILTPILNKESETKEVVEKQSETEAVLKAQLTGQKSIVQALLKLTNITRTLLEDKDKEKSRRENPRSSGNSRVDSREEEEDRKEDREKESEREERRPPRRNKKKSNFDDFSEEYYDEDSEYYYDSPPRRSETLVERIATSAGNRALKGNQALFEEFVKLAIERQRWEQAQDVTNIIKSTLTTEPPPEESEEYYYSDEEIEERPRSQRPKHSKKRPTERPRRPSKKRPNIIQEEEDSFEVYEEDLPSPTRGRPRPSRPRPSRPRTTKRPRTTTPEPVYEYDFEDYPSEEEYEDYPLDSSFEDEISLEEKEPIESRSKFPTERLQPQRGSNIRQKSNADNKSPSIKDLINSRPKTADRPRFQTRGRFSRPGRRNEQKSPQIAEVKQTSLNQQTRKPAGVESKSSGLDEETRRPSFDKSEKSGSRLTASNLNAKDNKPSIIEVTTPKAIKVETRPPVVKSKPTDKSAQVTEKSALSQSDRDKKRNELKENLLQSLLNHSKKKAESERATEIPKVRSDSPRKLAGSNVEKKEEEQRSSGLRGSSRGRKFGRGGIPSRRRPNNAPETSERLTFNAKPQKKSEPITEITNKKSKTFKDAIAETIKAIPNPKVQIKAPNARKPDIKSDGTKQKILPAIPADKPKIKEPFVPTRSPPEIGSKRPESQRPKPQSQRPKLKTEESKRPIPERPQSLRPQSQRPQSQRSQGRRPQSQRAQSDREQAARLGSKKAENTSAQRPTKRPAPPRSDTRRPQAKRPKSQRPQSQRPEQISSRKKEEENEKAVLPLNDEERKNQKNQRNSLLKQLSKNRGVQRQTGSRNNRPKPPVQVPEAKRPQTQEKKTGASALENLFSIISSGKGNDNDASKTVIKVTSTSSSSSSSSESSQPNIRIRPHGKKQGKRKKSVGPSNATPTEDPSLQNLTPQERLVKKVQETLISGENKEADHVRPKSSRRKKVIFRKKKTDDDQLPRSGRKLDSEGTQIKTVKVRVRRIVEAQPFPIVY